MAAERIHVRTVYIDGMRFVSRADGGVSVVMDTRADGAPSGATPMELLLMALTGCSGIDVVHILHRMRVPVERFEIEAYADRAETSPKRFTRVYLVYRFDGAVPRDKAERAIRLSLEKYCSVYANLQQSIELTWDCECTP